MATFTDTRDNTSAEAVRIAQDAAYRYVDESMSLGRSYFTDWSNGVQTGMRTMFDLQNAMILASRTVLDASVQATRSLADQTVESVHKNQDATMRLFLATAGMAESTMPKGRP